jgi:fructose-1,6-bisphosphatase/sedoheptulose 1,7-bisphosphatase-like protein
MEQQIGRDFALELVRVTEAAALAAGRWMGRGQKESADQAAVDAMRTVLNTIPMDGVVVIGEGAKDKAPMLFEGEHLGCANEPKTDIAVDPIDGTRLLSQGMANSIATLAVAERGTGIDVLMGIGGAPEAVVAACALRCLGGGMQCKLWPRNDEERAAVEEHDLDVERVLTAEDLVHGHDVFFAATGITDGELLKGVHYFGDGASTESIVMRSRTGTIRRVDALHRPSKLDLYGIPVD